MLNAEALKILPPHCNIINFARGELIDVDALASMYDNGSFHGNYVADFPDKKLQGNPRCLLMPHLGASTGEAEEVSAAMAADEVCPELTRLRRLHSALTRALPFHAGAADSRLPRARNYPKLSERPGDEGEPARRWRSADRR